MVDTLRGLTFGEIAANYSRYRPAVPVDAVDWLLDGIRTTDATVVDLGAGTGALSRVLVGRVARVVAVEPDSRMRTLFTSTCPQVEVLAGTAESMPLPDDSADAVVIAMAWHWVDADLAMPEIARVLRPGGTLGVLWNHRDLTVPWVAELDAVVRTARARASGGDGVARSGRNDVADPPTGALFTPLQEHHLTWPMTVTADELVQHLGTDASAIALSDEARAAVDDQVTAYVRDTLGLDAAGTVELPMACRLLRTTSSTTGGSVTAP